MNHKLNNLSTLSDDHPAMQQLFSSGLTKETLAQFPILYIDKHATTAEKRLYHDIYGDDPNYPCVLFSFPKAEHFGIRRCLDMPKDSALPKYLSPAGKGKHLYILTTHGDDPFDWTAGAKDMYHITEGIKKALKLWQTLKLDTERRHVIIAIDGITTFFASPEHAAIGAAVKDCPCFLYFDCGDFGNNKDVRRELLTLYAWLKGKQAGKTVVCFWNHAKGIDDYLANQETPFTALQGLLETESSPFQENIIACDVPLIFDHLARAERHGVTFSTVLVDTFIESIMTARTVTKKKTVYTKTFNQARKQVKEQLHKDTFHQATATLKKTVNWPETVMFPYSDDYQINAKMLCLPDGEVICPAFIVSSVLTNGNGQSSYRFDFADGKVIDMPSEDVGDPRALCKRFNGYHLGVEQSRAKVITTYFAGFFQANTIPVKQYKTRTGWVDDVFAHPAIMANTVFDHDLETALTPCGDPGTQMSFLQDILLREENVGMLLLFMLAAPLVAPLGIQPLVINIVGQSAAGKTTALYLGASLFGNPEKLVRQMKATLTGLEQWFVRYNDFPVFLDESKTLSNDRKHLAKLLKDLIFLYTSGTTKLRSNKQLGTVTEEYQGLLFLTSNLPMETMIAADDGDLQGTHRRVLDLEFARLWQDDSQDAFKSRYAHLAENYGQVGAFWFTSLQNGGLDQIRKRYARVEHDLPIPNCHGAEQLLQLAYVILQELCNGLKDAAKQEILSRYKAKLTEVGQTQAAVVNAHLEDEADQFMEALSEMFAAHRGSCFVKDEDKIKPDTLLAYIDPEIKRVYVTSPGLKAVCASKFSEKRVKKSLVAKGYLAGEHSTVKKLFGLPQRVYDFILEDAEEVPNTEDYPEPESL